MGDASTATTTLSTYVAEDWAGCLADEASIKLLCSKGMPYGSCATGGAGSLDVYP